MSKIGNDTKKLTNAGSAAALMVTVAFIAALGGLLLEPVGYFVHLSAYNKDVGLFSGKVWHSFFTGYDKHIIIFLLALAALFICFEGRKKRRIGSDAAALIALTAFGCLLASLTSAASSSDGGTMEYTWATVLIPSLDPDMVEFDQVMAVLYYVLPIAASGLLLILGIFLWLRADVSSYEVSCPRNDKLLSSSSDDEPPVSPEIGQTAEPADAPKDEMAVPEPEETVPDAPQEDKLPGFDDVLSDAPEQPEEAAAAITETAEAAGSTLSETAAEDAAPASGQPRPNRQGGRKKGRNNSRKGGNRNNRR